MYEKPTQTVGCDLFCITQATAVLEKQTFSSISTYSAPNSIARQSTSYRSFSSPSKWPPSHFGLQDKQETKMSVTVRSSRLHYLSVNYGPSFQPKRKEKKTNGIK